AWRNMWRSRRRTLITISSIFFAVIFAILMRVMMIGVFDRMIKDTVSLWCGYAQIHHTGYWENKSVDSTFEENPKLVALLNGEREITAWTPHLETFALASTGERTKGMMVIGIDPAKENSVSGLSQKIISGKYLADSDRSIMLAEGLADYLKLKVNDTVILLGQGYEGNMAAGKYPVKGIVKLGIPEMNKSMAWMPMAVCQSLLSTGPRYTSISIMVDNRNEVDVLKQKIMEQTTGLDYEVMTWQEMNPGLDQMFQLKMGQNKIMSGILYLVIAFGIFGTILMMLNERMHEFGILIAIGMRKGILARVVVMEMVLMSLVGTIFGIIGAFPIVYYFWLHPIHMGGTWAKESEQFNFEPIIQPTMDVSNFIIQGYVVLSIAIVLSLYAIFKIHKIKAIVAINS
ncbi:MAG TPA: FtsX-like permease family protein, partial [Bacteroidia bacterium]|nr:FtsX-like permease family protein [Bacteroidia bacterium]